MAASPVLTTGAWAQGQTGTQQQERVAPPEITPEMQQFLELLRIDDTIDVMRNEGLNYGSTLAEDMLPDVDLTSWERHIERIYDADKMRRLIVGGLAREVDAEALPAIRAGMLERGLEHEAAFLA